MTRRNIRPASDRVSVSSDAERTGDKLEALSLDQDQTLHHDPADSTRSHLNSVCKPCRTSSFSCSGTSPCGACQRRHATDQCTYIYSIMEAQEDSHAMVESQYALRPITTVKQDSSIPQSQEERPHSRSTIPPSPTFLPDKKTTNLINADLLITGHGEPLKKYSVITQLGKIMYMAPTSSIPPPYHSLPTTSVPVLLPGLWDCHTHLLGATSFNFSSMLVEPPALAGARLARNCHDILMSGFTSVRDLGSHALEIVPAIQESTIPGPNIYSAGAAISQTAGHGDVFDLPSGWVSSRMGIQSAQSNNYEPGRTPLMLADGVDEVRRAVRLQIRRGAHVIKCFASGGVLSIADDPLRQQFSDEELHTIVTEAERAGRVVAAHVHGKVGIMAALKAGVKTIEHGTYMDDECADLMIKNDVVYVPTRTIVRVGVDHPELMSPESYKKMVETAKHHLTAYRLAVKKGVKIALGTDLGISSPVSHPLALGKSGGELVYAVQDAGMTPLEAIEAATSHGPTTLGKLGMAPRSGRIEPGYDADLIAVTRDPLKEIEVFMDARNVSHVWKGGKVMKSPKMKNTFTGE